MFIRKPLAFSTALCACAQDHFHFFASAEPAMEFANDKGGTEYVKSDPNNPSQQDMQSLLNWALKNAKPEELHEQAAAGQKLSEKYTPEELQEVFAQLFSKQKQPNLLKNAAEALDSLIPVFENLGGLHRKAKEEAYILTSFESEEYDVLVPLDKADPNFTKAQVRKKN